MSKIASYKIGRVTAFLENKLGVVFRSGAEPTGWYWLDGKKQLRITVPKIHGSKDLTPKTAKRVMNSLRVTTTEFDSLYNCPMRGTHYEAKIRRLIEERVL